MYTVLQRGGKGFRLCSRCFHTLWKFKWQNEQLVSNLKILTSVNMVRGYCKNDDSDAGHSHLKINVDEKDPELQKLLQEITKDFQVEEQKGKTDTISSEKESKEVIKNDFEGNIYEDFSEKAEDNEPIKSKAITDDEVDTILSQYNIEEFYGVEPTIEFDQQPPQEQTLPISLERGITGVFDIEEVVSVLDSEKIKDVCVIKVPPERQYVDYMVIGTGRSTRHLLAVAEHIKWIYKKKRLQSDRKTIHIEGTKSDNWLAMDIGNIALHLMLESSRHLYDIETLWTCGPEYDTRVAEETEDQYSIPLTSNMSLEETKQLLIERIKQAQQTEDALPRLDFTKVD